MTVSACPIAVGDCSHTLCARCLAAGWPAARLSASGELLAEAGETPGAALVLLGAIGDRLRAAATEEWASEGLCAPVELWPGAWALATPEVRRRRRVGFVAALYLTPWAITGNEFESLCRGVGLDPNAAREELAPCAVHPSDGASRAAGLLEMMHSDIRATASASESVAGFSRQLSESYEEISFLYTLGASMNQIVLPERFVRLVCEELLATLAFRWVGVAFGEDASGVGSVAGRAFGAGSIDESLLRPALQRLLRLADAAKERLIPLGELGPEFGSPSSEALVQPVARDGRLLAVIVAGDKGGDDPHVSSVDVKLVAAAGAYLAIHLENAGLYEDQQSMFLGTLKALTASIDAKDRYTRGHSERVAHLTRALGAKVGLDSETLERVHIAGLVHDVGKIGVPESVLRKTGALTDEEFAQIKLHPEIGHTILKDIPQLADVLPGVLHHHERWDGRGYPHGLRGEDTPRVARLIALADSFDAMSSTRTYRPAMDRAKALSEIRKGAGTQFDPALAEAFATLSFEEYDRMVTRHGAHEGTPAPPQGIAA